MENNLELKIEGENLKELTYRTGEALPLREPQKIGIIGTIGAVTEWMRHRIEQISPEKCYVLVNRDLLTISLLINDKDYYSDSVVGKIEYDTFFKKWEINTGKKRETHALADFIKMNRTCFEDKVQAMNLVSVLKNFKAKVNKDLENANDNRGNRDVVKRQTVESNIPESFKLTMPLFKGLEKQTFSVEIYIDADDFGCSLVSPDCADIEKEYTDLIFNDQKQLISQILPAIPIIEQ